MSAPSATASLADWLAWQERLHPRSIELGLERVRAVGQRLGLPASGIHTLTIAGTNGKGSSATLAALIYREAGYRVGLYTSPHLLHYRERIAIDGVSATDAELVAAFVAIERVRGEVPLTYFEFGTLAALWLFRARGVQVQVLEVGLGGRLDAVNLVDSDAALLTNIGLDHTDWLGPDRESIAAEKAAVFRPGCPAICADPDPPQAVERHARDIGAVLRLWGRDYRSVQDAAGWTWSGPDRVIDALPSPALAGAAQVRNASGVLALVQSLQARLPVAEAAIRAALPRLALRGRFERIGRTVFDVAHNVEAVTVLADNLRSQIGAPVQLVLGMLADKPARRCAEVLAPLVSGAHLASLDSPRGLSAAALAATVGEALPVCGLHDSPQQALQAARAAAGADGWVLVTGSFLTVAACLPDG